MASSTRADRSLSEPADRRLEAAAYFHSRRKNAINFYRRDRTELNSGASLVAQMVAFAM